MNKDIAREIINALSSGVVPKKYAHYYNVGREQQVRTATEEIKENRGKLRFVKGDYGMGKTHFLVTIGHWAIKNGYIPSHVVLSPRGTPLHDLRTVYSRIIKECYGEENIPPIKAILEFFYKAFQRWLDKYYEGPGLKCEKYTIADILECSHCYETSKIEKLYIPYFEKLPLSLQRVITEYRYARWGENPDFEKADMVIRWIEGESFGKRDLNYLGVWENLYRDDILISLKEISRLVSLIGKKGVVIMLDEAEDINELEPRQRLVACENLQLLIEGAYRVENIYFLYATTPTFFYTVNSYSPNLKRSVENTPTTELIPLSLSEIKRLASMVSEIYVASLKESDITINKRLVNSTIQEEVARYDEITDNAQKSARRFITSLISKLKRSHNYVAKKS